MSDNNSTEPEKVDRIDRLNKRLYSPHPINHPNRPGALHPEPTNAPHSWSAPEAPKHEGVNVMPKIPQTTSVFKKFFVFSLIFLAVCLIFAGYMFFIKGTPSVSSQNIDMNILGNAFTPGGEELPLQIELTNRNSTSLEYADLILEYPKGSDDPQNAGDYIRMRKSVGTIAPGKTITEEMSVTLFGTQGSTRDIKVTLEYRIPSSNAILTKDKTFTVNISSVPLSMTIDGPEKTSANQEVTLSVKVLLNSSKIPENLALKMDYPSGFKYTGADIAPAIGNNLWDMTDLVQGKEKTLNIKGIIEAQDGEEKSFHAYLGERDSKNNTAISIIYLSYAHLIQIERPFLEAHISIDGDNRDVIVANSESDLRGVINWRNNLSDKVLNAVIVAKLSGDALDKTSVKVNDGFYDSKTNEITWDQNTLQDFSQIQPGDSGDVSFDFSSIPLDNQSGTNPEINISVSIKGTLPSEGNSPEEVNSFENKTIQFAGNLSMLGNAFYYDGPFKNTGPVPPKVEKETTYTISWKVMNSNNPMQNIEVRGILPVYVKFTSLKSPETEDITFNAATREVIWKIPSLARQSSRQTYFQISITPSVSQTGTSPVLVKDIKAVGGDTFTKSNVSSNGLNISTVTSDDSTPTSGRVTN